MATDPLDSARTKLARAEEHLAGVNMETGTFLAAHPYGTLRDVDATGTKYVFRLIVRDDPPLRLSVLAGDVIQNARAALDHAVVALAHHQSPVRLTEKEEGKLQFPIVTNPADFVGQVNQGRLSGIHDTTFIEAMQPYHGGSVGDVLALLNRLSNVDKHRRLSILTYSMRQGRLRRPPDAEIIDPHWSKDALVDGAVIARFVLSRPCPEVEVELEASFGPTFEPVVPGSPVPGFRDALGRIITIVESVLGEFGRRFR
ncbi:MAG: hypothetical protein ACRD03_15320 [Acidimicrobiales bacterium]